MAVAERVTDVVVEQALAWPSRARALAVTDGASYVSAAEMLLGIKALRGEVNEAYDSIIATAFAAHREACGKKRAAESPLIEAERIIKDALRVYDDAQQRLRDAEQRRLDAEATKKAEDDAVELAAHMETEGHAWGDETLVQDAHALINAPIVRAPVAPVAKATPIVTGITYRKAWKHRITNEALIPREYLKVDEPKIAAVVRALGANARIAGVEVYPDTTVSAGRR